MTILVINAAFQNQSLSSCLKGEFCGKQIPSKCKVEMGRAVGPVPILKCKIRVWKNGVATELVLFTSPHLTLRGKHTLKKDSILLNNCWHKWYKIHKISTQFSGGFQHTAEQLFTPRNIFEANKELLKQEAAEDEERCLVLINGRLEVWEISCPIIHIHDKLSAACIICPCVERFRVEYVNVKPR